MKISQENTIKALLVQKQSQSNSFFNDTFSSLLNQNEPELEKDLEESTSTTLDNHYQNLQYKAYLNKLSLGIAG